MAPGGQMMHCWTLVAGGMKEWPQGWPSTTDSRKWASFPEIWMMASPSNNSVSSASRCLKPPTAMMAEADEWVGNCQSFKGHVHRLSESSPEVEPEYLDRPLVVGCSIGKKKTLLVSYFRRPSAELNTQSTPQIYFSQRWFQVVLITLLCVLVFNYWIFWPHFYTVGGSGDVLSVFLTQSMLSYCNNPLRGNFAAYLPPTWAPHKNVGRSGSIWVSVDPHCTSLFILLLLLDSAKKANFNLSLTLVIPAYVGSLSTDSTINLIKS